MSAGVPRVLFATSECGPWLKTGGLADVAEALPPALARLGLDVRVVVPGYRRVLRETADARTVARLAPSAELPSATIREARLPSGIVALVIDAAELFDRDGGPYQDANGADWPDNALRFGLFSRAAALIAAGIAIPGWQAEVLHLNDWQTGLAAAYLHYGIAAAAGPAPRVVFTVHNLAFQGLFPHALVARLGLPAHAWSIDGVEFFGQLSCMKAGLQFADAITTVSPSYALEIRSAPLGCGLEGLLEYRAASLHGIVNGIDTSVWNPADDPFIPARYDAGHLDAKGRNKAALQARFGLAADSGALVFGFVGRFTRQKGVDLIVAAAPRLCALPAQLAILGSGEHELEAAMRELAARLPGRVAVLNAFDESLAHLIEAGADVFLMPSRYEPCGLNQMYSQRYGTPPVAHATGGLRDTIVDCTADSLGNGSASGFLFADATAETLLGAVTRAWTAWRDPKVWRQLQRNGMERDFGWDASAARYLALYREVLSRALR